MRIPPSLVIDGILKVIGEGSGHHYRCQHILLHQPADFIRMGATSTLHDIRLHILADGYQYDLNKRLPITEESILDEDRPNQKTRQIIPPRHVSLDTPCTRMTPFLSHMKQKDLSPAASRPT